MRELVSILRIRTTVQAFISCLLVATSLMFIMLIIAFW